MANRFLNNIKINDEYTLPSADGTADQIIKTDGAGQLSFIDQGDVIAGEADKAKSVILRVKNATASPMTKGQVICESVSASPPGGNLIEVALADNNGTNTMPALGILNEDLDAAGGANDEGDAIMFGKVSGINTSAFSVGDEVFVSDVPGGLTITKPTGVKYIQKVGVVIRDDNTNGTIEVFGAGRVNDVPTPLYIDHANQRLGIGTTSPQEKLHVQNYTTGESHQALFKGGALTVGDYAYISLSNGYAAEYTKEVRLAAVSEAGASNKTGFAILTSPNANGASGNERLRVTADGNVGIGTTTPAAQLEINDSSAPFMRFGRAASYWWEIGHTASDFQFNSATGGTIMHLEYNGNVGVGTTSPSSKLQVDGGVQIADDTDAASASKVGTLRYRTSGNNSYVDMCMQTAASTYAWVNIVQNTW